MQFRNHKSVPIVLRAAYTVMLALLATSGLARELTWKQHNVAKPSAPRKLAAQRAKPMPKQAVAEKRAPTEAFAEQPERERSAATETAAETPAQNAPAEPSAVAPTVEPIPAGMPAGHLHPVQVLVPATDKQGRQAGYYAPGHIVQPWHPHPAYPGYSRHQLAHQQGGVPMIQEQIEPGTILEPGTIMDPGMLEPSPLVDEVYVDGEPPWGEPVPGGPPCGPCWPQNCCYLPGLLTASISTGTDGFKGPADLGVNGNFGLSQSVNFGGPLLCGTLGFQVGARFIQSGFGSNTVSANIPPAGFPMNFSGSRSQTFFTAGLFRRATACRPWQWGIVVDLMRDNHWYRTNLSQLRIEASRRVCGSFEIGTTMAIGTGSDTAALNGAQTAFLGTVSPFTGLRGFEATDQYTIFARRPVGLNGEAKIWGGMTGKGDGLMGSEVWLPITGGLAFEGDFNYLFSNEGGNLGRIENSFGMGLNFIWHPYFRVQHTAVSPFRPLFPVASNSRFFFNFR